MTGPMTETFDPFNCPKCGRHDFGLLREEALLGRRPHPWSKCDEAGCPLNEVRVSEPVSESIRFLGVECKRTTGAQGAVVSYEGEIKRGPTVWWNVSVHHNPEGEVCSTEIVGQAVSFHAGGSSIAEAERNLRRKIAVGQRDMDMLGYSESIASPTIAAALYRFGKDWESLPPLIRAGLSHMLLSAEQNALATSTRTAASASRQGLSRRARVHELFRLGHCVILDLMVALIREADAEAERRGVDSDLNAMVHPEPSDLANILGGRDEVIAEGLGVRASKAIAEELDAEVMAEFAALDAEIEKPE